MSSLKETLETLKRESYYGVTVIAPRLHIAYLRTLVELVRLKLACGYDAGFDSAEVEQVCADVTEMCNGAEDSLNATEIL